LWKRGWLRAWMIWLKGLLGDIKAALGTRHNVIHDPRYLEDIIRADLESQAQPPRSSNQPHPGPGGKAPSERSGLRQGSGRRYQ
jgi:hypothetical protein